MSKEQGLTPYETREILFYKTENGEVRVEILLFQENLWLTQAKMAELFEVQKAAISKHLKNIFESGELSEDSVVSKMETTAADGKRYQTNYYNLDAIIAVGYRVNSKKATMFRIWANRVLKEFIIKGYVMDDARLREPENFFGKDYFEEQLERIRDIRASERRFYQKITDIYSQCSADYDVESPITKEFFAMVQNKPHYAVTHHTAAEIVYWRADSTKPNMGLTTWKNAPKGRIRKSDVTVAKNYLNETEMKKAAFLSSHKGISKRRLCGTLLCFEGACPILFVICCSYAVVPSAAKSSARSAMGSPLTAMDAAFQGKPEAAVG
ncbi:MAG: RhuM family protein [Eubacteriales bacterium]|nr:RhuM family protein [Eubacteriales bacterium]